MKPDFQRRVQRYGWTRAAVHYDPGWEEQLRPAQERLLKMAALQLGEKILDVACGTGLVTIPAARTVGPEGRVLGVDISEGMLEEARQTASLHGLKATAFKRMDAEQLDLNDAVFDAALCSLGLMYMPDPRAALREMHRVLRPGGRVVASVWGRRDRCGWASVFPIVDRQVASEVCPLFFQLGTGEALAQDFRSTGFEDVFSERFTHMLHFSTDEELLAATFEAGAVALAYDRFDAATRETVHRQFLESVEDYRNGRGYDIPGEFVLVRGLRTPSPDSADGSVV